MDYQIQIPFQNNQFAMSKLHQRYVYVCIAWLRGSFCPFLFFQTNWHVSKCSSTLRCLLLPIFPMKSLLQSFSLMKNRYLSSLGNNKLHCKFGTRQKLPELKFNNILEIAVPWGEANTAACENATCEVIYTDYEKSSNYPLIISLHKIRNLQVLCPLTVT